MKQFISLIAILLLSAVAVCGKPVPGGNLKSQPSAKEMLRLLDAMLDEGDVYSARFQAKRDSLATLISNETDTARLANLTSQLAATDSKLNADSAIVSYSKAIELYEALGDDVTAQQMRINIAEEYINSGDTPLGLKLFNKEEKSGIYPENEIAYNSACARSYFKIGALLNPPDENLNLAKGEKYARRWAELTPHKSPEHYFAIALIYMAQKKPHMMASALHDALEGLSLGDYYYCRANIVLGEYYWSVKNYDAAIINYVNSAMSNVQESEISEVGLLRLGEMLYELGDKRHAYRYLANSLEKTINGNQKFNLMRINSAYTEVNKDLDNSQYQWVYLVLAFLVAAILFVIVLLNMMVSKRTQVAKLKDTERRLARANEAKETFISEFLNLSSSYIEEMEVYNKQSQRRLIARQYDELLAWYKSGRAADNARRKFNEVFDHAMLQLFPHFIDDVNNLLLPDKQIAAPEGGKLNTELRLAALSRLGIEDPAVIARSLGISTNTIYTYRNKLRTRAKDRNNIDEQIRSIGLITSDEPKTLLDRV